MRAKVLRGLCNALKTSDALAKALHIGIKMYSKSECYDDADDRFSDMINPLLEAYSREHIIALLEACESNSQTRERRRASRDHNKIKQVIDEKFSEINIDMYPLFKASLN